MISTIIWDKFRDGTGVIEPLIVHFPSYNKGKIFIRTIFGGTMI